MRDWTISQRILASFAAVIVAMAVMSAVTYVELNRIDHDALATRNHSLPELERISEILAAWYEDYSISQEIAIQANGSKFDGLSAEIQASRAALGDALEKYRATAIGAEIESSAAIKKLVDK